jgi:hypothetical protein
MGNWILVWILVFPQPDGAVNWERREMDFDTFEQCAERLVLIDEAVREAGEKNHIIKCVTPEEKQEFLENFLYNQPQEQKEIFFNR